MAPPEKFRCWNPGCLQPPPRAMAGCGGAPPCLPHGRALAGLAKATSIATVATYDAARADLRRRTAYLAFLPFCVQRVTEEPSLFRLLAAASLRSLPASRTMG